jgi:diacylglycerol kinase family enzyme
MGVLYSGTSPDFCRFHGIPVDPDQAMKALLTGTARSVDVTRINYRGVDGRERVGHFGCSCNIGLGASIARFANRWRRYLGDVPGTGAGLIRALLLNQRIDLELVIDGEALTIPQINNLSVIKNPYLASGLRMELDVLPDDGTLYLVGISGRSRGGMCRAIPTFYTGAVTSIRDVLVRKCRSVTICAQKLSGKSLVEDRAEIFVVGAKGFRDAITADSVRNPDKARHEKIKRDRTETFQAAS